jgi:DNA repair protein RadA/Sms
MYRWTYKFAEETNVPVILIDTLPKTEVRTKNLEHMVDTVLQFEGDRNQNWILRSLKKPIWFYSPNSEFIEMLGFGFWQFPTLQKFFCTVKKSFLNRNCLSTEGMRPLMIRNSSASLFPDRSFAAPQRSTDLVIMPKDWMMLWQF